MNWLEILLLIFILSIVLCFISDKLDSESMVSFFGIVILASGLSLFTFGFAAGVRNEVVKGRIYDHQILYETYQQNKNIDFEDHKDIVESNRRIRAYKEANKSIWGDPFYLDKIEEVKLIKLNTDNNGN